LPARPGQGCDCRAKGGLGYLEVGSDTAVSAEGGRACLAHEGEGATGRLTPRATPATTWRRVGESIGETIALSNAATGRFVLFAGDAAPAVPTRKKNRRADPWRSSVGASARCRCPGSRNRSGIRQFGPSRTLRRTWLKLDCCRGFRHSSGKLASTAGKLAGRQSLPRPVPMPAPPTIWRLSPLPAGAAGRWRPAHRKFRGSAMALAGVITQLHETGHHPRLEAMREDFPGRASSTCCAYPDLRREAGAAQLYKELRIASRR